MGLSLEIQMKRLLTLSLAAVLAAGLAGTGMAQSQFPDVPDNHWAYQALQNLKDKVLFGYPDGLYRGSRPMTRYEFAVAVNQLWQVLAGRVSGVEDQVKSLEEMIKGQDGAGTAAMRDQVASLGTKVNALESGMGDLKKLTTEFEKELAALGVDVDKLKADVASLDKRVEALEKTKPAVLITGDANLLVLAGHANDGRFGLTTTGRRLGVGRGSYLGNPVGATRDLSVLHEAALRFSTTNDQGPKFAGTLVVGNVFGAVGGQNTPGGFGAAFNDGTNDIYIQDFTVTFDTAMFGQGFSAVLGRVNAKVGRYLFERPDFTPYFENERWDNGNFTWDGGILTFNFGQAKMTVLGGRNVPTTFNGVGLNTIPFGPGQVDQSLGALLDLPLGENFTLRGAYLFHDSNTLLQAPAPRVNRVNVAGAELKGKVGPVNVGAAYSNTPLSENTRNRLSRDVSAWEVNAGIGNERYGLNAAYRKVEQNFSAAGNWGRLGLIWNPRNIQGFNVKGFFKLSDSLKINAGGEFVDGVSTTNNNLIGRDDKATSFNVGLDYVFNPALSLMLNYEDTKFDFSNNAAFGDPTQRWYTLGLRWNMSSAAFMSFTYQYSDVDFRQHPFGGAFGDFSGKYKGGMIGTQVSIKF